MPLKNGNLKKSERAVAQVQAKTGDARVTSAIVGMHYDSVRRAVTRPEVQAEIVREQTRILYQDILPLAVGRLQRILADDTIRPADHNQAIKIALTYTMGTDAAAASKQPHEMDPDELAKAIADAKLRAAALESVAADRARPIIDGETDPGDIFD